MRRLLAAASAAALVLLAVLASAAPASAHAVLTASTPGDGARLDDAPESVRLEFSEAVSADLGGLRVFSAEGDRVDEGDVRVEGGVVEVDLAGGLEEGGYAATYRVVSADGHPVQGGIVFSVGDVQADPSLLSEFFDEGDDRTWEIAGAAFRWLAYLGTFVAAGGALFLAFVHDGGPERGRLRRLVGVGAVLGGVGILAALPVQAALATGEGLGALFDDGVLGEVLEEGVGPATALGLVGLALLFVADARRIAIGVGVVLAAGSFALAGHTRSTDNEVLAIGADIVHTVAAAAWFGGLVLLALTVRARRDDGDPAASAGMVERFSRTALVVAGTVTAAGLVLAWSEVRAVRALTSTTYGWTLLAKVAIVALVALVGLYNRYRLIPAVRTAEAPAAWRLLGHSVRLEAGALAVVLALTAALVNVTPARSEAGIGEIFSETVALGDAGSVNVVVDPNQAGRNAVHLYFYDADGRNAEIAEDVTVTFSLPANDLGPIVRKPFRAGPAHFQVDGNELITGGRWLIAVTARISRFEEVRGEVEVLVGG